MIHRMRRYVGSVARRMSARLSAHRKLKALSAEGDLEDCVNLVYRHVLGRDADPDGLRHSMASIRAGMTFACFVQQIETSSEAAQRKSDRSDGEFILGIGELLFQHGSARPAEIEHWRKFLREDITRRRDLIHRLVPIALAEQHRFGYAPLQSDKC